MRARQRPCFFLLLGIFLAAFSCNDKPREFQYQNSTYKYITLDTLESEIDLSSYMANSGDIKPMELGKYTDEVRVGNWAYFNGGNSVLVSWARYKNDQLKYKTNLFSKSDTIIHGPEYTRLRFTSEQGVVIVSIVIKKPIVFEPPNIYFSKLENVLSEEGSELRAKESQSLFDGINTLYIVKKQVSDPEDSINLLQNLLTQIPGVGQVEISVLSRLRTKRDASILFDGILTNFFIEERRLYNPFKGSIKKL
ncbi:MAG: hypothetical protein EOO09_14805 [Chitinophagaceae bacterium]|nr:MAG: hypothetical protein EOO09_14805 [Chitinophagaceae bacterium]